MFLIILFVVALLDVVSTIFDVTLTETGIAKGVGVEGNEVVTTLSGTSKPGRVFLYLWNGLFIVAFVALGLFFNNPAAHGIALVVLAVDSVKHWIGGRMWKTLLKGGTIKQDHTIWQKFLGLGW